MPVVNSKTFAIYNWRNGVNQHPAPKPTSQRIAECFQELLTAQKARTVYIHQPHSNGDVLFLEPVASLLKEAGHNVIWPVHPAMYQLRAHQDALVLFEEAKHGGLEKRGFVESSSEVILPMAHAQQYARNTSCMRAKYTMLGLGLDVWFAGEVVRRPEKELELFKLVGADQGPYALLNTVHTFDGRNRVTIKGPEHLRHIHVRPIEGYTLVDWSLVMEKAEELHMVNTSTSILAELINLECSAYHLYPRKLGFNGVEGILRKPTHRHSNSVRK